MQRTVFRICIFFVFLTWFIPISGLGASGHSKTDEAFFVVRVKDNVLSVKVRDIPLKKVLTEIANQTSIKVTLYVPTEEPLSVDFSDVPLEKGLKRLTRDYSSVFIYGSERGEEPEIREVIIYAKTGSSPEKRTGPRTMASRKPSKLPSEDFKSSPLESQVKDLRDKDPSVRKKALEALAGSGDDRAIIHLGKVLVKDKNDDVRATAAGALGELGDERAVVPLIQALGDKNARVRESAADALCQIGGENVIRALEGCLSNKGEDLRKIAADALKMLKAGE